MKPPPFLPLSLSRQEEWGDSSSKKRRDLLSSPSVAGRTREREMEGGRCYSHPPSFYYSALRRGPSIHPSVHLRVFSLHSAAPNSVLSTCGKSCLSRQGVFQSALKLSKAFSLFNKNKNQHFLLSIFFLVHIKRWEGQWSSESRKKPGGVEGGLFLFTCFLSK